MKHLFFSLCFLFCSFVFSQSGVYVIEPKHNDGTILKWTLQLNNVGTFSYHFLRDLFAISKAITEENFYGKGTWKAKNNLVFFASDKKDDLNEKYSYNFTNTKARWIKNSPRDLSDKVVNESLLFYESDLWVIKGLKFIKKTN